MTLSKLESSFIAAARRAPLPLPETNTRVGAHYVDCRCEREARARGDEFRRYTWFDVAEVPAQMLADLRALLTRRLGPAGSSSVGDARPRA